MQILEPSFYWRLERDYDPAPPPHILYFGGRSGKEGLPSILRRLSSLDPATHPRVILHPKLMPPSRSWDSSAKRAWLRAQEQDLISWANHSIGVFASNFSTLVSEGYYRPLPSLRTLKRSEKDVLAEDVIAGIRNCMRIFAPPKGNRTCFQICD